MNNCRGGLEGIWMEDWNVECPIPIVHPKSLKSSGPVLCWIFPAVLPAAQVIEGQTVMIGFWSGLQSVDRSKILSSQSGCGDWIGYHSLAGACIFWLMAILRLQHLEVQIAVRGKAAHECFFVRRIFGRWIRFRMLPGALGMSSIWHNPL